MMPTEREPAMADGQRATIDTVVGDLHGPRRLLPAASTTRRLRVLFLVMAHNSLSQRVRVALVELGHEVEVAVIGSAPAMVAGVTRHRPDVVVCPVVQTLIAES